MENLLRNGSSSNCGKIVNRVLSELGLVVKGECLGCHRAGSEAGLYGTTDLHDDLELSDFYLI